MTKRLICVAAALAVSTGPALAEWRFSDGQTPSAFMQTNDMTLELQCDRIRFAFAGCEESKAIIAKQAMSIRVMKDGAAELGAFQVGQENAIVQLVDDHPVEILFREASDDDFVLDQVAANAVLNLSIADSDVSYGLLDLTGSAAAVRSLRVACAGTGQPTYASMEVPKGAVYCGGGALQRQIEYLILDQPEGEWDAVVTVNGERIRAMTAYSYFGNFEPPRGFVVALLGEDRSEFLIFEDGGAAWLEYGDQRYDKCN